MTVQPLQRTNDDESPRYGRGGWQTCRHDADGGTSRVIGDGVTSWTEYTAQKICDSTYDETTGIKTEVVRDRATRVIKVYEGPVRCKSESLLRQGGPVAILYPR